MYLTTSPTKSKFIQHFILCTVNVKAPLTSVWPLFLICTIHDHFYVLLVLNSLKIPPTILQRPASVCLCGNLGDYSGNIDSNSCLDLCDCCPIKNTHRQDMCSFKIAKNKLFSLDLTHAVRLNIYRSNLYGFFCILPQFRKNTHQICG